MLNQIFDPLHQPGARRALDCLIAAGEDGFGREHVRRRTGIISAKPLRSTLAAMIELGAAEQFADPRDARRVRYRATANTRELLTVATGLETCWRTTQVGKNGISSGDGKLLLTQALKLWSDGFATALHGRDPTVQGIALKTGMSEYRVRHVIDVAAECELVEKKPGGGGYNRLSFTAAFARFARPMALAERYRRKVLGAKPIEVGAALRAVGATEILRHLKLARPITCRSLVVLESEGPFPVQLVVEFKDGLCIRVSHDGDPTGLIDLSRPVQRGLLCDGVTDGAIRQGRGTKAILGAIDPFLEGDV